MRRSTKKKLRTFMFLLILCAAGAYFVMFSGILNMDRYNELPVASTQNLYNIDTKQCSNLVLDYVFRTFASAQMPADRELTEVIVYDRVDNIVNATSDLYIETHSRSRSTECVSCYILTCKLSSKDGWFYKAFSYDNQKPDFYFPFQSITLDEIKAFTIGQTLTLDSKEFVITDDNLKSIEIAKSEPALDMFKDVETVKAVVTSDIMEYTGNIIMSFTFVGSSWELESKTQEAFASEYKENSKPSFTEEDYKQILVQNPYQINPDYKLKIEAKSISDIKAGEGTPLKEGETYEQPVSFKIKNDHAVVDMDSVITFVKSSSGWNFAEISYSHEYEDAQMCGTWSGNYSLFIKNPEIQEVTLGKNPSKKEKEEYERIQAENSNKPQKVKAEVAMVYEISGTDESGNLVGTTTWGLYSADEEGNKVVSETQETTFVAYFDKEKSTIEFVFDKALAYATNYQKFDVNYDFVNDLLTGQNITLERSPEEEVEEESTEESEETEGEEATSKKKEDKKETVEKKAKVEEKTAEKTETPKKKQ